MSIANGIWLCGTCALLIDKNGGRNFSVTRLGAWKRRAEKAAANALLFANSMQRPIWVKRLSTLHYVNVPRLEMWDTEAFSMLGVGAEGFGNGFIGHLLVAANRAVRSADMHALPLDDIMPPSEELVGSVFSFHARCFTKNGQRYGRKIDLRHIRRFDPKHSPYFYLKAGATRVVFPYDPRWITTNTAHTDFNSGQQLFAGIGLVKRVSDDLSEVIASPLIVGLATPPSMDRFYGVEPDA